MLTKGIVIRRSFGDNKYDVRIPILESAGSTVVSDVPAILSHTPGIYESYEEGDVVIVGFEEHSAYNPIIVGKLFLNGETPARGYANFQSLSVSESVELPANTKVNGYDLGSIANVVDVLNSRSFASTQWYRHVLSFGDGTNVSFVVELDTLNGEPYDLTKNSDVRQFASDLIRYGGLGYRQGDGVDDYCRVTYALLNHLTHSVEVSTLHGTFYDTDANSLAIGEVYDASGDTVSDAVTAL